MSKNIWELPLDVKFRYSESIPRFRRKDSAVLNIRLFDTKKLIDISDFSSATLSIQLPSKQNKKVNATRQGSGADTYVQYQFTNDVMTEIGLYTLILTVEKDGGRISTQKFSVYFYDNESNADFEFINMMQKLQLQINYLDSIMDNLVLKDLIGKTNGLIPLNAEGKIPLEYMPLFLEEHINTNLYLTMVHGLMVDEHLNMIYEGAGGNLEYVGHKEGASRLTLSTSVANGVVTLTYTGVGTVTEQRWKIGDNTVNDMKVNGTVFTGNKFTVVDKGMHTIYFKDASGKEYLHKFNVNINQLAPANYNVYVEGGFLKVEGAPQYSYVKIAEGIRDLAYMKKAGNGVTVLFPHPITKAMYYTIYIIDIFDREILKIIEVKPEDLQPLIDNRPLKITLSTSGYYQDKSIAVGAVKVWFSVTDADGNSAVDKLSYVIRPNSTTYSGVKDDGILITKNGTYTWTAYNKSGISSTATLKIDNIGQEKNLNDLPIGSEFYLFQSKGRILKRENGNSLVAIDFGWNYPFSNQYVTTTPKNLYPNSSIANAVYNYNLVDHENQKVNNIIGNINYQYGTVTPESVAPVGQPVYTQGHYFVLDAFTISDAMNAGYLTPSRNEMTTTPIQGSDDNIVRIDGLTNSFDSRPCTTEMTVSWIGMWFNNKTKVWQKGW